MQMSIPRSSHTAKQESRGPDTSSIIWCPQDIICSWLSCFYFSSLIRILSSFRWMLLLDIIVAIFKHNFKPTCLKCRTHFSASELQEKNSIVGWQPVSQMSAARGAWKVSLTAPSCWGTAGSVRRKPPWRLFPRTRVMCGAAELEAADAREPSGQFHIMGKRSWRELITPTASLSSCFPFILS